MKRRILVSAVIATLGFTTSLVAAQHDSEPPSTTTNVRDSAASTNGNVVTTGVETVDAGRNTEQRNGSAQSNSSNSSNASNRNPEENTSDTVESQAGADVIDLPTPRVDAHGAGARGVRGDDDSRERAGLPPYRGPVQRGDPSAAELEDDWAARAAQMNRTMRDREWRAYQRGLYEGRNERIWDYEYRENRSDWDRPRTRSLDDRRSAQWQYGEQMEAGPSYSQPRFRNREDWRSDRGWNSADAWADYYQGQDGQSDSGRGWADMGRSSEYYDFRDPRADREYDRSRDRLRDRDWRESRNFDDYDQYSSQYNRPDARYAEPNPAYDSATRGDTAGPRYRDARPDFYYRDARRRAQ